MMTVHFNHPADFAARQAGVANSRLTKSLEKLSSGYRINRASDDAGGLGISEKLRAQVRGLTMAQRNVQDAISLVQTADDSFNQLMEILQRMRELSVQASNGNLANSDRNIMQVEVDQLLNEINRMMTGVEFNQLKLLDGTFSSLTPGRPAAATAQAVNSGQAQFTLRDYNPTILGVQLPSGSIYQGSLLFQVGPNENAFVKLQISTISAEALGLTSLFSSAGAVIGRFFNKPVTQGGNFAGVVSPDVRAKGVLTQAFAQSAIVALDSAINNVSRRRAAIGALTNELERRFDFLGALNGDIQQSESRIRDTDMATEIVNFTLQQITVQAAQSMIAQANVQTQLVLQLLR